MKAHENPTTLPWSQREIEAIQQRLRNSKRLLDAFPGPLDAPALVPQVSGQNASEVEALLLPGTVLVGREGDPPFQFPEDNDLSRQHFRILVGLNGHCYAEDLASTNGLWINGRRVDHRHLQHGDVIHAGNQDWVFHDGLSAEEDALDMDL